uniref:Myeloid zinc finger 1 n=1 Tax=Peromyscus maniculatus bairdii TaxID=230844 RepID=A0A8C8T7C9_PERMB
MRPTVLGSPGRAPPENEPVVVKLEDSEEEGEGTLWDPGPEAARLRFRCFRYEEAIGPQEALAQLRELCHQWLRPEVHSKEQMLDLLVLEQFLGALPPEIQTRVQGQWPGSPEEAAALVDSLQWELDGPRKWSSWSLGLLLLPKRRQLLSYLRRPRVMGQHWTRPLLTATLSLMCPHGVRTLWPCGMRK